MRRILMYFLCAVPLLLSAAGCEKDAIGGKGSAVQFQTSTPKSSTETKTSYSGSVDGSNKERIDWTSSGTPDQIRIYCTQCTVEETTDGRKWCDYTVTSASTTESGVSRAVIAPSTEGVTFSWGEGTHDFYAVYPSPATEGMDGLVSLIGSTMTATIPSEQTVTRSSSSEYLADMRYAYMYASKSVGYSQAPVQLDFRPEFGAFTFSMKAEEGTVKLYKFTFTTTDGSKPLAGVFSYDGSAVTPDSGSRSATLTADFTSLEGGCIELNASTPVKFTVLTLPVEHTALTISFLTDLGVRSLKLKYVEGVNDGSYFSYNATTKYIISGLVFPKADGSGIARPGDEGQIYWYTAHGETDPVNWDSGDYNI